MATLNEIIYDIKNSVYGGTQSDDSRLSDRQIIFEINNTRSLLIRQDIQKRRSVSESIIQSLGCIEVEPISPVDCCIDDLDCKVLRTRVKIPRAIETDHGQLFTRVGPIDLTKRAFNMVPFGRSKFVGTNKFNKDEVVAFINNDYIYIIGGANDIEMINVQGVFEDPTKAAKFKHCTGESCYSDNSLYPISTWMLQSIVGLVYDKYLRMRLFVPVDDRNNAADDTTGQPPKNSKNLTSGGK